MWGNFHKFSSCVSKWQLIITQLFTLQKSSAGNLAPVVQTLDSAIHWINHYPLDNSIGFAGVYPLDSDLSGEQRYPSFEQLGPEFHKGLHCHDCDVQKKWLRIKFRDICQQAPHFLFGTEIKTEIKQIKTEFHKGLHCHDCDVQKKWLRIKFRDICQQAPHFLFGTEIKTSFQITNFWLSWWNFCWQRFAIGRLKSCLKLQLQSLNSDHALRYWES